MFNQRNRNEMLLRRVEPNTRDCFLFTILLLEVGTRNPSYTAGFSSCTCVLITKHFKIVLENINDFVRLERCLHAVLDSVDKLIKLFIEVTSRDWLLSNLIYKVFRSVLNALVDWAFVVGLGGVGFDSAGCLQTHFENLFPYLGLSVSLALVFEVDCVFSSIFLNHLVVLEWKLLTGLDHTHSD